MYWVSDELLVTLFWFSFIGLVLDIYNSSSRSSERDINCVIFLTTLQSSCASIYIPSLRFFVDAAAFSSISHMQGIHAFIILQSQLYLVGQRCIVLVSSTGVPARNKGTSKVDSLRAFSGYIRSRFASVLAVVSSDVIEEVSLYVGKFEYIWVNLSFHLREYFLALVLTWPNSIDYISSMSRVGEVLNLDGFSTDSNPAMPFLSFSLLGGVVCLVWTVIFSMSKS